MNLKQLEQVLREVNRATFVTIVAETQPRMRKTDNPYAGHVIKRSRVNGAICWIYKNAVQKQLDKQEIDVEFQPQERKWGERLQGTPFVEHKGKLYLEMKVERSLDSVYIDVRTGEEVDKEKLQPFLQDPPDSVVVLRDYALENIKQIAMKGALHIIEG